MLRISHVITLIHFLIVLFVVFAPICSSCPYTLVAHALFIPLLIVHWKLNDDGCCLTELEKRLTNKTENKETFIGSILGPVYEPRPNEQLFLCLTLWLVAVHKLKKNQHLI